MANTNIELDTKNCDIPIKNPKRVLHFSDGTIEEYSDTDDEVTPPTDNQDQVDTSTMSWGPWLMHKTLQTGHTTLGVCDYVGEALASFLGITTPKYQFEIEEYRRIEAERKQTKSSSAGWLNPPQEEDSSQGPSVSTEQPASTGPTSV